MASVSQAGAQIVERIQEIGLSGYLSTIRSHHSRTYTHCLIVTAVAASFGIQLGFGRKDRERVAIAGLLHDIGKSQIALDILEKPAELSEQERAVMNAHPVIGYDMLRGTPGLADILWTWSCTIMNISTGQAIRMDCVGLRFPT